MTVNTPLGEVRRDDLGLRLEFVRLFPTDVRDLWSAVTESDRCVLWFGAWSGDPASGTVELVMTAEEGAPAQSVAIVECTEPARLVIDMPSPDGSWRLSLEIGTDDVGSRLVFTQRLADTDEASSIGPGWHFYLDRLAAVVDKRTVPDDWGAYEPLADQYQTPH